MYTFSLLSVLFLLKSKTLSKVHAYLSAGDLFLLIEERGMYGPGNKTPPTYSVCLGRPNLEELP